MTGRARAACIAALAATTAPQAAAGSLFTGLIEAGYRWGDVQGDENRYREDVNLWSGPRLARLEGQGKIGSTTYVVTLSGLGGDPYPQAELKVKGERRYAVSASYRGSDYDYASPGDVHSFSTFLRRTGARVELFPSSDGRDRLELTYDRTRRAGGAVTTRGIDFDKFIAALPASVESRQDRLGLGYRRVFGAGWLVQGAAAYTRIESRELALGLPPILPLPDPLQPIDVDSSLDLARRESREEATMPEVTLRVENAPASPVNVAVSFVAGRASIDADLALNDEGREAGAHPYYLRDGFTTTGSADYRVLDASVRIPVSSSLSISQSLRVDDREQEISGTESGEFGFPPGPPSQFSGSALTRGDFRTTSLRGDLQWNATGRVSARAGYRVTMQEIELVRDGAPYADNSATNAHAVFGLQHVTSSGLHEAKFEIGKARDPFTPLSARRSYVVALRVKERALSDTMTISVDIRRTSFTNSDQGLSDYAGNSAYATSQALAWTANAAISTTNAGAFIAYAPSARIELTGGYTYLDASVDGDILYFFDRRLVAGEAEYDERVHMLDARVSGRVGRKVSLIAAVSIESASGTRRIEARRASIESSVTIAKDVRALFRLDHRRLDENGDYLLAPLGGYRATTFFVGLRKEIR